MALANDLLLQAHQLVSLDARRPKQASLRRAISTAYYALFHLLVAECARRLSPPSPVGLAPRIARSLVHTEMRDVCQAVRRTDPGSILVELHPRPFSDELRLVAKAFINLQEARHVADYDLTAVYTRTDATDYLKQVDDAFEQWRTIRVADEANIFLAALMFARRWSK